MKNELLLVSLEDRVDNFIDETLKKEKLQNKIKRQQDKVMILQEKDIVSSLIKYKGSYTKKMKNFFKLSVATGLATLGLAQVAPVIATVGAIAVGYSLIKTYKSFKKSNEIELDVKIAKKNVNTMLATLQGGKVGIYQITQRIAHCRKALSLQEMNRFTKTYKIS